MLVEVTRVVVGPPLAALPGAHALMPVVVQVKVAYWKPVAVGIRILKLVLEMSPGSKSLISRVLPACAASICAR